MTWVNKEIERWYEFQGSPYQIIPADMQVGKILSHMSGDVTKAAFFIARQIEEDGPFAFDSYWYRVKQRFDELHINSMIEED